MKNKPERMTKIKCKDGEWKIAWQRRNSKTDQYDKLELTSKDMAREELDKTMQKMGSHIEEICELPQVSLGKPIVLGIAVSYDDNHENAYMVITASIDMTNNNSPWIINTPVKSVHPGKDMPESYCMTAECYKDLLALEDEALKYIHGERAQQKLDFEKTTDEIFGLAKVAFTTETEDGKTSTVTLTAEDAKKLAKLNNDLDKKANGTVAA
ncbi:MAG: hypothetical protein IJ849_12170 [Selenomonadaceae bacterium]|nr:hypothetical protein [Selenomonadaceae bacterium]